MLEETNVKFYMNDGVTEIRGNNGKVALFLVLVLLCPSLYKPVLKKCIGFKRPQNSCKLNENIANLCF